MRRYFLFGAVALLLFFLINPSIPASEESEQAYSLPALIVSNIPLDDNLFRREVFSLKEVREGDSRLLERIIETRMDFPLMIDPLGRFATDLFPDPYRVRFGKNFSIVLWIDGSLWQEDSLTVLRALKSELAAQDLDQGRVEKEIRVELMIFLKNYNTLCAYVANFPDASSEARSEVVETLEQVFGVCRRIIEFKLLTLNGIRTLDEIDSLLPADEQTESGFALEQFVAESKDMKAEDFSSVLEIRNPDQFRKLCLERTSELLADTEGQSVEGLLAEIEPSDAIVLAAYFARDRIQEYQKPVDQMRDLEEGESKDLQVGDCRYFAGLAVHYLNIVVKPANPKLQHWHFGIERENISDFHHAYVKAVKVYKDDGKEKMGLFFFDPVALSSEPLGKLHKKDVRRLIDAASKDNHFFSIKRYGEDFVALKRDLKDAPKGGPDVEPQAAEISFDALFAGQ